MFKHDAQHHANFNIGNKIALNAEFLLYQKRQWIHTLIQENIASEFCGTAKQIGLFSFAKFIMAEVGQYCFQALSSM